MLKRLLQVPQGGEEECFGDLGYIEHSGVLDKTEVAFDLIVKVRPERDTVTACSIVC